MSWSTDKPTEPGLYWWRWGIDKHDAEFADGAEIVRVWVQPMVRIDNVWWVSHIDRNCKVELQFTGGEWWPERIKTPKEQAE